MQPKYVLIVSDFAHINGGQAKVSIDSAKLLADHGINVIFFAAVGPVDTSLNHPKIEVILLNQNDILTEPSKKKAALQGIWNTKAAEELRKCAEKFDKSNTVLHCHGYAKALSPSIGPVIASGRIASVYTMHEYFLACPNGGFYDYKRNEICTSRPLGVSCLTKNCDVRKPLHKAWRVARQVSTWGPGRLPQGLKNIIYISETQRKAMAPYLSETTNMYHVPNPIPAISRQREKRDQREGFIFVGRLNPEKGGHMFAAAARRLGVASKFVGDGVEANKILKENPNAQIAGWQKPEAVQEMISKAKALVFPSLWYEGQPLVPLEALCLGVPVVAGRWSAAAEAIKDGSTGVIYDEPSEESLANAMSKALQLPDFDPEPIRKINSPQEHLRRLLEVYDNVLSQ